MRRLVWADPFTVASGELRIGVCTTPNFDAVLRKAVAAVITRESVKPNYYLQPAATTSDFHFLFWGGCPALRTRDPERFVAGLRAHLGGHQEPAFPVVRTHRINAVVLGDRAVLIPDIRSRLPQVERRLRDHRAIVVDQPWADFDAMTGELVVTEPQTLVDTGNWDRLARELDGGRPEPRVDPGRYRLAAWLFKGQASDGRLSRTDATLLALNALSSPSRRHAGVLDALGTLFAALPTRGLSYGADDSLIEAIASLERA